MRVTKYYDPIESQKVKLTDKIEVKTKNRRVLVVLTLLLSCTDNKP